MWPLYKEQALIARADEFNISIRQKNNMTKAHFGRYKTASVKKPLTKSPSKIASINERIKGAPATVTAGAFKEREPERIANRRTNQIWARRFLNILGVKWVKQGS